MAATRTHPRTKRSSLQGGFSESVFVNCPFDKGYIFLLWPLLFTIIYLGFKPRIALESKNSGAPRIDKIVAQIRESMYAIHDLSRIQANKKGEFFRLNMPFELGLDVGCRLYSTGKRRHKKCLILEAERFRYQAALSDISGSDIETHNNDPRDVVVGVRNWLSNEAGIDSDGPEMIWASFNDFLAANSGELQQNGFLKKDIEKLPVGELLRRMRRWCGVHG
jgi:hypothetical protein